MNRLLIKLNNVVVVIVIVVVVSVVCRTTTTNFVVFNLILKQFVVVGVQTQSCVYM